MDEKSVLRNRERSFYKLDLNDNLPPGTDSISQFEAHPRQPRPPAEPKRPVPEWPPEAERKGKWISAYLDQLDPETEYDRIIQTSTFFTGSSFAIAMGYTSTLILLTQTPAGASAVHSTGKLFRRGHQRFYETQDRLLDWMWYGSASPQAFEGIERVNKIHAGVWKNAPGTFSHPWEGQMSLIGSAYFETYLRDLVGARVRDIHPKLAAAWPAWAERACAHFRSEPEDGSRSFGVNFPRDWKELEAFHKWYRELPFDKYTSEEERLKGAVISKGVVDQFAELWFPRYLQWFGRQLFLTIVPPKVREQQRTGHPNPLVARLVKLFLKIQLDLADIMPDPARPILRDEYHTIKSWEWYKIDAQVVEKRRKQALLIRNLLLGVLLILIAIVLMRGWAVGGKPGTAIHGLKVLPQWNT
ncbi:hypothetical protein CFIO01_11965 [Colletotrichum fioriniae PJ7]|uniref:ER-bound oxygenase mpaB/mpaB'/Rubber oxygenase catalytic domain-containing protein n=1 Tax=Colletotrichum fioriniae PJ7 TaxID=1445577 RepID=A0A010S598_9PEZI|nr:hypothetical protein CFIO01_11965 [Colletotrichum fioriniae PJ7]